MIPTASDILGRRRVAQEAKLVPRISMGRDIRTRQERCVSLRVDVTYIAQGFSAIDRAREKCECVGDMGGCVIQNLHTSFACLSRPVVRRVFQKPRGGDFVRILLFRI